MALHHDHELLKSAEAPWSATAEVASPLSTIEAWGHSGAAHAVRRIGHLVAHFLAAKDVEAIDGVKHYIIVDGIVFGIAAHHRVDGA